LKSIFFYSFHSRINSFFTSIELVVQWKSNIEIKPKTANEILFRLQLLCFQSIRTFSFALFFSFYFCIFCLKSNSFYLSQFSCKSQRWASRQHISKKNELEFSSKSFIRPDSSSLLPLSHTVVSNCRFSWHFKWRLKLSKPKMKIEVYFTISLGRPTLQMMRLV
jgi:hypothetical protein